MPVVFFKKYNVIWFIMCKFSISLVPWCCTTLSCWLHSIYCQSSHWKLYEVDYKKL